MTAKLLLLACGGKTQAPAEAPPEPDSPPVAAAPDAAPEKRAEPAENVAEPTFKVSAADNYALGMAALAAGDWKLAAEYFAYIKERFPYSKYGVLSELRLADADLGAGNLQDAFEAFKLFVEYHPTHEMTTNGYAPFMVAEAQFRWLELPPESDDDPRARVAAWNEIVAFYESFITQFPGSAQLELARKRLAVARTRTGGVKVGN